MEDRAQNTAKPRRRVPLRRAAADLSLRSKLRLFALALVTIPGVAFALMAFAGARAALEREVVIQLHQTAELGADAVAAALERARGDARAWARQEVMRELLVGDVDKRVSKLLHAVADRQAAYLEALCVDNRGTVVAASRGEWIGRRAPAGEAMAGALAGGESLLGPSTEFAPGRQVIAIGVPIDNPDTPGERIGALILVYDWGAIAALLDGIRVQLEPFGKRVAALVVDGSGAVIGGVAFDGETAQHSGLAAEAWRGVTPDGSGRRRVREPSGAVVEALVGAAPIADAPRGWSVLLVERAGEALAAVRQMRDRWIAISAAILAFGLVAATLLARQVMRPLSEITQATGHIAAHPDLQRPLLPVRSRDEIGQLTESFNAMTTALKRSQEEALSAAQFAFAGELAAMVAHEVRTPLSVMRSSAQLLADTAAPDRGHGAELAEMIVAEVDRVERVVTGLIQLARPLESRPEPTPLRDLLLRAAAFVEAQAQRQGVRISCEAVGDGPPAWCDAEQIYQVILNLVINALQALPAGGHIALRTLPAESGLAGFGVADDGPGLPDDVRNRLFQPFASGREGGTGLGLAFVDRVVKTHRGSVSVRSAAGSGTEFTVRLPIAEHPFIDTRTADPHSRP